MQVRVEAGDIAGSAAPAVVVNLFEGVTAPGEGPAPLTMRSTAPSRTSSLQATSRARGGDHTSPHARAHIRTAGGGVGSW